MSPELTFRGRRVLLVGTDSGTAATVHALLRGGARVTVDAPEGASVGGSVAATAPSTPSVRHTLGATLEDLAQRGLVTRTTGADPAAYDVVIRSRPVPEQAAGPRAADKAVGTVTLVGGGLGDPGLLTVAGLEAICTADVIVHDRLAPLGALQHARADAVVIDVGKIPRGAFTPQESINALLIEHARAGRAVLRLKGGDNFVFGRGGEEAEACAAAGVPVVVVPGVSSSIAAPALAGIPVTHRTLVQGFTVVSGHVPPGDPRSTLDWGAIARSRTTIVVLMGVATLEAIANELMAQGLPPDTPAAVIADAGLPSSGSVRAPLCRIAEEARVGGLGAPAVAVIGAVAALDVLAGR
ncbi:uroporphyrin-III C-methyltransferase [Humibacillus xanthopallidus]|uniref:uroporphyrinogen-III C-methyltransferase n=1 Tax=Humibacillus xanthopallidus TaxID=412689 RepID=A0A543PL84_9MICO|nr:uroporphyrinogen-III C-methyltransferase [Humibacillus xanthopallidus]TQN44809.1 uroporphyrin-III C-methyltransferase [Humibacillus xanthopallidus]